MLLDSQVYILFYRKLQLGQIKRPCMRYGHYAEQFSHTTSLLVSLITSDSITADRENSKTCTLNFTPDVRAPMRVLRIWPYQSGLPVFA